MTRKSSRTTASRRRERDLAYTEFMIAQRGRCGICGAGDRELFLDHDHGCCNKRTDRYRCGQCYRGLLCRGCNSHLERTAIPSAAQRRYLLRYQRRRKRQSEAA